LLEGEADLELYRKIGKHYPQQMIIGKRHIGKNYLMRDLINEMNSKNTMIFNNKGMRNWSQYLPNNYPTMGRVLTATSATTATWRTPTMDTATWRRIEIIPFQYTNKLKFNGWLTPDGLFKLGSLGDYELSSKENPLVLL